MSKLMILAFGLYWISALLLLLLVRLLMRRVRIMSMTKAFLASTVCAAAALAAGFALLTLNDVNISGGSGIGAVILGVVSLAFGGLVGLVCVCITAYVFSTRHPSPRKSDSVSRSANVRTLACALCILPAALLLFDNAFKADGVFIAALVGMVIGIAGIRESFLPDVVNHAPRVTRGLLWLGAAASILGGAGFIWRFLNSHPIMHSRGAEMLVIALVAMAIPTGLYVWRLRTTRVGSVT